MQRIHAYVYNHHLNMIDGFGGDCGRYLEVFMDRIEITREVCVWPDKTTGLVVMGSQPECPKCLTSVCQKIIADRTELAEAFNANSSRLT